MSRRESSEQGGVQILSRCSVTVFWPFGRVSSLSPLGARPGVDHDPRLYITAAAAIIRLWGFA
jgi:hypothetical protein